MQNNLLNNKFVRNSSNPLDPYLNNNLDIAITVL